MNPFKSQMKNDMDFHQSINNQEGKIMTNQLHLESLKEELANAEMKNRQLAVYSNNAIDLLSEIDSCFLHNNQRYSNKVKDFIAKKPETALAEYQAHAIEKAAHDLSVCQFDSRVSPPPITKESLLKYAEDLRKK